nr:MAG TPA: hypothetical protein [Caudoviricetes sp.]
MGGLYVDLYKNSRHYPRGEWRVHCSTVREILLKRLIHDCFAVKLGKFYMISYLCCVVVR